MAKLVGKSAVRSKAIPQAKSAAKTPAKPAAKTAANSEAKPAAAPARLKQRVAISHLREDSFVANGLRAYAQYRDLGIARASHGMVQAHVIRLVGPCNPAEVSKLHFHDVDFQMVYVLSGWVKADLEGHGEILMREGSCWTQPPRIRHKINDYSDDCELLEVILPAEFDTVELTANK
ncbi:MULTISPECIES: cupin domain-containing protein [Rhodopseudomonas]|uniref:Cupin n=1 Tax=Rhodopseudomonas palustris TaxID=1076 RepID=A0A0D7EW71_RHOPL|nr:MULTISPECIES: cupin domain-containing protein [Rhodopseudomonas]KIZ45048.1 cupin [Rhodopseudomonas palustris]MDF3814006.1 cupin domain-containing protein [Rhodopseudomonas sp. BAL398]WOK20646.1 cupin domain-containing protein [Rhodopseudomonas sp. BAL398]